MRRVSAGIPRAIAQRLALAATAALVMAAPAAADPLGETAAASAATAGALSAQATQGVAEALPAVGQAAGALPQPAEPVRRANEAVAPAAKRAPHADVLSPAAEPVRHAAEAMPQPAGRAQRAADAVQRAAGAETPVGDALRAPASPAGAGGELPGKAADATTRTLGELSRGAPLDAALQSLGDGLHALVPIDALTAPLAGLLSGAGLADLAPARLSLGRLLPGRDPGALGGGSPFASARDVLGAHAQPQIVAPPPPAAVGGPALTPSQSQSASAPPPAAEARGRPGSSSPRKAPAPATGGAGPVAPGGLSFVPFLGLLVLAALAAPMLLRRLRAATASLRPAPFICALERPG